MPIDKILFNLSKNLDTGKYDPKNNKKFLSDDIYDYNRQAAGIRCSKDQKAHFTVKNINSYLNNDLITKTSTTPPQVNNSDEEQIKKCDDRENK